MTRETWYRRKPNGRYEPVGEAEHYDHIIMPPQGFVLTHRRDGVTQWEYGVKPDNASFVAAAMAARTAMEEAIRAKSTYRPQTERKYTKKQLGHIEQFKADMGMAYPDWWTQNSARDIAQAGIDAVIGGGA